MQQPRKFVTHAWCSQCWPRQRHVQVDRGILDLLLTCGCGTNSSRLCSDQRNGCCACGTGGCPTASPGHDSAAADVACADSSVAFLVAVAAAGAVPRTIAAAASLQRRAVTAAW